jgi:putative heme iron utilization protein
MECVGQIVAEVAKDPRTSVLKTKQPKKTTTDMRRLTTGIRSEKRVVM